MNTASSETPRALWVDTDIALGAERGDVDDGFSLAAVLGALRRSPAGYRLLGVSAVDGNTDAATAAVCAQQLLDLAGLELRVTPAAAAAERIAALPAGASLLCLGPLTHAAAALRRDAALAQRIELRAVCGLRRPWRHPLMRWMDLNTKRDPAAARAVLDSSLRRRRFPLDVVQALRCGTAELARLESGGSVARHLARHSQRWQRQTRLRHPGGRFPLWDLVAALDALDALPQTRFEQDLLCDFDAQAALESFFNLLEAF